MGSMVDFLGKLAYQTSSSLCRNTTKIFILLFSDTREKSTLSIKYVHLSSVSLLNYDMHTHV